MSGASTDRETIRVTGGDSAGIAQPRSWPALRRQPVPGQIGYDERGAFFALTGSLGPAMVREMVQRSAVSLAARKVKEAKEGWMPT